MNMISDRLAQLTAAVETAVRGSGLSNADAVTVSNSGTDFVTSRSQAAGAVIVYPYPQVQLVAPRSSRRLAWTIGIVAGGPILQAAARCADLLDVVVQSGVVQWRAEPATADPTDFALSEDPAAPRVPGWAITITEEHMK